MRVSNMRIDLSGRDVAMAKHCLNTSEVGPIHK